ncbi:hypothetical protein ARMGADRAFT_1171935 [Armillaria gallica]|uniref:Uncharacterized protein n=1 Tax=Armillaria gallica TaxID=47427 RepID=A0A2H3CWA8_ARMGA|nr:hypothetical protein ARMGADRAFT_1171935 [Armillaria gallica]
MGHAISINGINWRQGLKKTLDLYFSHSHFFMQGLGDDADDDVHPTTAYRHGIASENGRKANKEDVDDVQTGVATGGGTIVDGRYSQAIQTRTNDRGACKLHACIPVFKRSGPALPPYRLPKPIHEIPPLPVEVLTFILSLLLQGMVNFTFASCIRAFSAFALYRRAFALMHLRPSASYHPPCNLSSTSSNRPIYYHFYANLHGVSSYDYPQVPPSLCSLPPLHVQVCRQMYGGKKTLCSAIVICPAIEELKIEEEGGEECWCSIIPHLKSLHVLVMRKPGTTQIKAMKEELDERFPLLKRARTHLMSSAISHSGHSMVISEHAHATHLANACPALQHVIFLPPPSLLILILSPIRQSLCEED